MLVATQLVSASASAQRVSMHREVPRGDVTGLEMSIDGSLRVVPGGTLRWFVTLYEVVRRRDLRPSPHSELRAMASFAPGAPVATVRTDALGRAAIEIAIPEDLESGAQLVVEATSPRDVRRTFDVSLELEPRRALELFVDRDRAEPGATLLVVGRLRDRVTLAPIGGAEVTLGASLAGPIGADRTLTTDGSGVFVTTVTAPSGASGLLQVVARAVAQGEHAASASVQVQIASEEAPRLLVAAVAAEPVVLPSASIVPLDVEVRTPDGAPVAGALIEGIPRLRTGGDPLPPIRTGADGRARVEWWLAPAPSEGALFERTTTVTATSVAHGSAGTTARVRVYRRVFYAELAVEGGALVPGAPGRVLARLAHPDGRPFVGAVTLDAPLLGGVRTGTTDADGVVAFRAERVGAATTDDCGGPTATQVSIRLASNGVGGSVQRECLPVDPDATLGLSADPIVARTGGEARVQVRLARRAGDRAPVAVTLLSHDGQAWVPIAEALTAPGAPSVAIALPPAARGELWVRARPVLASGQSVRGASTMVVVRPTSSPSPIALTAGPRGAEIRAPEGTRALAVAVSPEQATRLIDATRSSLDPAELALSLGRTPLLVEHLLASRVPEDTAASAIQRGAELAPQAMPSEPVALGLLRDPWRTRARFVRGRIGRLMLAVESYVEQRIPEQLDEVAVRGPRGWSFNREMLEGALEDAGLGDEAAAALDGEPLDIAALTALDPSFTYDHVARRITRARMWRVALVVHRLAHERRLDLEWARRGDPRTWLASLAGELVLESGDSLEPTELFDAWGHVFVLRPARGRAAFLPPIPGWELASAGPDGREGTGDDLVDPFARVLPSGSLYAEAVGEDALLGRLGGVALGRATLEALVAQLELEGVSGWEESAEQAQRTHGELPAPLAAAAPLRVWALAPREAIFVEARGAWALPPQRRSYAAVALAFGADGTLAVAREAFEGGAALSTRLELPEALRAGDAIEVPIDVIALEEGLSLTAAVEASGDAVRVRFDAPRGEGASRRGWLALVAEHPGTTRLRLRVTDAQGRELAVVERLVRVLPSGTLRAQHASALVRGTRALSLSLPPGARTIRASLVVASARSLDRHPALAGSSPSVRAWASLLGRAEVEPELAARVERQLGEASSLEAACALVALAPDAERAPLVRRAGERLGQTLPSDLRERAAVLTALAPAAPGLLGAQSDAVGALVVRLRHDGWRALATERGSPAVAARMAAALLLIDRNDAPGRALFEAARERLAQDAHGRVVPGDPERPGDGLAGTLALALAARQLGEDALADELASSIAPRLYLAPRVGAEGVFWALAASVYGALGGAPGPVQVTIDGAPRPIDLASGAAVIDLPASASVLVRGEGVVASLEGRFVRPFEDRPAGTLRASLAGSVGAAFERSALELVVEQAADVPASAPVVELVLPSAARFDADARAAIERAPGVLRVEEPDRAGVVRIHLSPLAARASHHVPIGVRWIGYGTTRGLALAVYDGSTPWIVGTTAAREVRLGGER